MMVERSFAGCTRRSRTIRSRRCCRRCRSLVFSLPFHCRSLVVSLPFHCLSPHRQYLSLVFSLLFHCLSPLKRCLLLAFPLSSIANTAPSLMFRRVTRQVGNPFMTFKLPFLFLLPFFVLPFVNISLPLRCFSLTFHCIYLKRNENAMNGYIFTAFHCLRLTPLPFRSTASPYHFTAFPWPFTAVPLLFQCLSLPSPLAFS